MSHIGRSLGLSMMGRRTFLYHLLNAYSPSISKIIHYILTLVIDCVFGKRSRVHFLSDYCEQKLVGRSSCSCTN